MGQFADGTPGFEMNTAPQAVPPPGAIPLEQGERDPLGNPGEMIQGIGINRGQEPFHPFPASLLELRDDFLSARGQSQDLTAPISIKRGSGDEIEALQFVDRAGCGRRTDAQVLCDRTETLRTDDLQDAQEMDLGWT